MDYLIRNRDLDAAINGEMPYYSGMTASGAPTWSLDPAQVYRFPRRCMAAVVLTNIPGDVGAIDIVESKMPARSATERALSCNTQEMELTP